MPKIKYPYEFDPKKRELATKYRRGRTALYFLGTFFSLCITLGILFSGFHVMLRDFVSNLPFPTIVYGFVILLTYTIFQLPISFYSSYIYEKKFNLSNYTTKSWLKDFIKAAIISYPLMLLVIGILYFTIHTFSPWWIYASIFYIMFSIAMNYIYPFVIVPFMWKVQPYTDKGMKEKILNLCRKLGVTGIRNVVLINESEKSVKPNAVFMGLGNSKRIGLFDNLTNNFSRDEIETVVGHELGHYIQKDILRGIVLESIMIFPILYLVNYFVPIIGPFFTINSVYSISSLPLIGLINGILGFLLMPVVNTHSRWRESNADKFALIHLNKPDAQISTEKKLADMSLSTLKANPFLEFWLFTHPSVHRRIEMAERWKKYKK